MRKPFVAAAIGVAAARVSEVAFAQEERPLALECGLTTGTRLGRA